MNELWPWMLLAGLGAFHGLNPAMGWLFAVALGVHRQSSAAVVRAVPAIALGHAVSIALVAGALVAAGLFVNQECCARRRPEWASSHGLSGIISSDIGAAFASACARGLPAWRSGRS